MRIGARSVITHCTTDAGGMVGDLTTHQLHQMLAYHEPQAGATEVAARVLMHLTERLEQARLSFGWDANTAVLNTEVQQVVLAARK